MSDHGFSWGVVLLLLLIVLGVIANTLLVLDLRARIACHPQAQLRHPDLPCAAIPTRLILEDPACAQKLLTVMNVTNFRILNNASQLPDLDPGMKDKLAELGMPTGGNRSHEGLP